MMHSLKVKITLLLLLPSTCAIASNVRTDYDHGANFTNYKTYSWGNVTTANPLNAERVKAEISKDLNARGWALVPSGGNATVFVTNTVKSEQELETMYDGMGGGWGGGWGWGGWGGWGGYGVGGFGDSTTSTVTQREGKIVLDIFDASSHKLLFRGVAENDLGNNSSKNAKGLTKDVDQMLKRLPKEAKS